MRQPSIKVTAIWLANTPALATRTASHLAYLACGGMCWIQGSAFVQAHFFKLKCAQLWCVRQNTDNLHHIMKSQVNAGIIHLFKAQVLSRPLVQLKVTLGKRCEGQAFSSLVMLHAISVAATAHIQARNTENETVLALLCNKCMRA